MPVIPTKQYGLVTFVAYQEEVNIPDVTTLFSTYPNITIVWKYKDNKWYSISKDNVINDTLGVDNNIFELFSVEVSDGIMVK